MNKSGMAIGFHGLFCDRSRKLSNAGSQRDIVSSNVTIDDERPLQRTPVKVDHLMPLTPALARGL